MVYYQDDTLLIRSMEEADAPQLNRGYTAQGWHPDEAGYLMRLRDQAEGKCHAITAVCGGEAVGQVYVYLNAPAGPFCGTGVPEIVDFGVMKKYQCRGIGSRLMDAAEAIAGRYADTVCLGVGLCREYGSAQRMYVKRGYIPDGTGVWYQDKPCVQYQTVCTVDDDLVLYMAKRLR